MSTKAFLPFLSDSSEPLKIYTKLQSEFSSTDIGKLFSIIMEFGLAKVKSFVSNFERTQESTQKELRLAIENHFALEVDYKTLGLVRSVMSICNLEWFELEELSNKDHKIDFVSLLYVSGTDCSAYIKSKPVLSVLTDREVILKDLQHYIKLDDEAWPKYKVSSLKELQAEILLYVIKCRNEGDNSKPPVQFELGDDV